MGPTELATARAAQERALTADCRVGRVVRGPLDEDTGLHPETVDPIWSGPCAIETASAARVDSAGRLVVVAGYIVKVPVEGTEAIAPGLVVEVTASQHDAALVGRWITLTEPAEGTALALRRFKAKEFP